MFHRPFFQGRAASSTHASRVQMSNAAICCLHRGLYRVHQFSKLEMFALSTPETSGALHEELISIEEELYTSLGLHFKYEHKILCA